MSEVPLYLGSGELEVVLVAELHVSAHSPRESEGVGCRVHGLM